MPLADDARERSLVAGPQRSDELGVTLVHRATLGQAVSRGGIEEMRLVWPRPQRDARAALGRALRLDARDELGLLAAQVGGGEDVRIGADLLDDVDARVDAHAGELQRLRPQPDDHLVA